MKCSETQRKIRAYLENQLPDEELEPFLKHMRSCPSCREDLEIYMAVYNILNQEDESYAFAEALDSHLERTQSELEQRNTRSGLYRIMMLAAEIVLMIVCIAAVGQRMENRNRLNRISDSAMQLQTEMLSETAGTESAQFAELYVQEAENE